VAFGDNCLQTNKDRLILSATGRSAESIVSGEIRFMRIFAGILWRGGVKRQRVAENGYLLALSVDISSEASETKP